MLERLRLGNFKAFADLEIDLAQLTLLTGLNSAGKSSVIQAILLCETARIEGPTHRVPLNGPFGLFLGESADLLHYRAASQEIYVGLDRGSLSERFVFEAQVDRTLSLPLKPDSGTAFSDRPVVGTYLSAERLGPRDSADVGSEVESFNDSKSSSNVGHQGQYTAHALAIHERKAVDAPLRHQSKEGSQAITLGTQVEAWLGEIAQPLHVKADWLPGANSATLRFRGTDVRTEWMRPQNVGFGVSYALPVIVAGLLSSPDSLFIVENPEAHLHPAGQAAMGRFLATLAAAGVQVLVETHSDHVVSGVRRAVGEARAMPGSEALVHYFSRSSVRRIELSDDGRLSAWPEGFFDQAERDLGVLARLPRA